MARHSSKTQAIASLFISVFVIRKGVKLICFVLAAAGNMASYAHVLATANAYAQLPSAMPGHLLLLGPQTEVQGSTCT
jgi:hypothetical protein